jgi:hypothetical protein
MKRIAVTAAFLLTVAGCGQTYKTVPTLQALEHIKPGDLVEVKGKMIANKGGTAVVTVDLDDRGDSVLMTVRCRPAQATNLLGYPVTVRGKVRQWDRSTVGFLVLAYLDLEECVYSAARTSRNHGG